MSPYHPRKTKPKKTGAQLTFKGIMHRKDVIQAQLRGEVTHTQNGKLIKRAKS